MNYEGDISLDILLFKVSGVHFGVDAGQVSGIADYEGEKSDDLFWFNEELEYSDATEVYFLPSVVTIRTECAQSYRVIVDGIEDVAEFSLNDIKLFPDLIHSFALRKGLWGILPRNGVLVMLVDFMLLLKQKRSEIN